MRGSRVLNCVSQMTRRSKDKSEPSRISWPALICIYRTLSDNASCTGSFPCKRMVPYNPCPTRSISALPILRAECPCEWNRSRRPRNICTFAYGLRAACQPSPAPHHSRVAGPGGDADTSDGEILKQTFHPQRQRFRTVSAAPMARIVYQDARFQPA